MEISTMAKDCKCVKLNLFNVFLFFEKTSYQNFCERESVRVCLTHGKPAVL